MMYGIKQPCRHMQGHRYFDNKRGSVFIQWCVQCGAFRECHGSTFGPWELPDAEAWKRRESAGNLRAPVCPACGHAWKSSRKLEYRTCLDPWHDCQGSGVVPVEAKP